MSESANDFRKELNFDSDTFSYMKRDLTFVLQRLLGNMQEKQAEEGCLNLRLEVKLEPENIPCYDEQGKSIARRIEKPKFRHKITSTVQIKDEKTGNLDTEMELVFDEDSGKYVMKPIANTTQRSIFDSDFQNNIQGEDGEESENEETSSGRQLGLPGPIGEDVVDGDFREVEDVTDQLLGDESDDEDEDPEDDEEEQE